jgi:hypothetical protein
MAAKRGPKKGQRHSGQWKPGQSGNPKGFTRNQRAIKQDIAEKLEAAFTAEGGDILVEAIVKGTKEGQSQWGRIGCDYRWGKPKEHVAIEVDDLSRKELVGELESVLDHLKKGGEDEP